MGVLIVPPVGYEYWSSYRTLRTLAERLAENGCLALRFDFDGTGDSAGDQWDPARPGGLAGDIGQAADALRGWGVTRLVVVGPALRRHARPDAGRGGRGRCGRGLGAGRAGEPLRPRAAVARACCARNARPSRAVRRRAGGSCCRPRRWPILGPSTSEPCRTSRPEGARRRPGRQAGKRRGARSPACAGGRAGPCRARAGRTCSSTEPTEYATGARVTSSTTSPAGSAKRSLCRAAGRSRRAGRPQRSLAGRRRRRGGRGTWKAGPRRHPHPAPSGVSRGTVVWLNSGSEHHVGPGRAWVEYARDVGAVGLGLFRVDFSGWGESPDLGHAPGRPYDQHGVGRGRRDRRGAPGLGTRHHRLGWALRGSLDRAPRRPRRRASRRAGPQSTNLLAARLPRGSQHRYGDQVRRLPEIRRHKRLAAMGVWSFLDALGARPRAAWFDDLACRRTPILAVFAEGDDGLSTSRTASPGPGDAPSAMWTDPGDNRCRHRPSDAPALERSAMVDAIPAWLDTVIPAPAIVGAVDRSSAPRNGD